MNPIGASLDLKTATPYQFNALRTTGVGIYTGQIFGRPTWGMAFLPYPTHGYYEPIVSGEELEGTTYWANKDGSKATGGVTSLGHLFSSKPGPLHMYDFVSWVPEAGEPGGFGLDKRLLLVSA